MTVPSVELTPDEARRLQLRAQGLIGAAARRGGVSGVLRRLGAVQLDTISVLARSHELVPYARLGAVGRETVENALWAASASADHRTFEYWAHAACVLPIEEWPYFGFRRRAFRRRGHRWHKLPADDLRRACDGILARLRTDGPLTTKDLGGAKAGADWWEWSDTKIAIEWLLDIGEVVCARRVGWRRVYDLPERVVPAALLDDDPDDDECLVLLVRQAAQALGVATRGELADYYRIKGEQVDGAVEGAGLVPVTIAGDRAVGGSRAIGGSRTIGRSRTIAWADPGALAEPVRGRHVTTLLSPFDSLVWDRKRTSRVFGFDHRLEAYVPKAKRVHGYFVMPLLAGGRLIGRVDPGRENGTLVARRVGFEPAALATPAKTEAAVTALRTALWQAAGWVGCDDVRVDVVDPPELAPIIGRALPPALEDIR